MNATAVQTTEERIQADPLCGYIGASMPRCSTVTATNAELTVTADSVRLTVGDESNRQTVDLNLEMIFEVTVFDGNQTVWRGAPYPNAPDEVVPIVRPGDYEGEIWIQLEKGVSSIPSQTLENIAKKDNK